MPLLSQTRKHRINLLSYLMSGTLLFSTAVMPGVALAEAASQPGHDAAVSTADVAGALQSTPGVLAASDQTQTSSDADSAMQAVVGTTSIDIPKDASEGVTLGSTDGTTPAVDIALPNAESAQDATQVAPGTVAYPANNGSANAVQATENGGVRMLTIIDNVAAPTAYDYKVTVPNGGHVELNEQGAAAIFDSEGQIVAAVQTPWAKDANGNPVSTYFTTDGQTLTQHIEHRVDGVAYPVTADPFAFRWYGVEVLLNRNQTNNVMFGMALAAAGSLGIPDPTISKIVAAALAVSSGYANWVYNRGGCVKLTVAWNGWWWIGSYYGGSCR